MKATIIFTLLLITLLTVSKMTYATTTLSLEKTGGSGTSYEQNGNSHIGDIDGYAIHYSYIKKFKVDIDYEFGTFKYDDGPPSSGLLDIQVGYPVISFPKGVVYVTAGIMNYSEYIQSEWAKVNQTSRHEANGSLLGLDFVGNPTSKIQFELNIEHSFLGGSSRLYYYDSGSFDEIGIDSSVELTTYRIMIQYIFTNSFGLVVDYRSMDYNTKDPQINAVDKATTAIGVTYRF